MNDKRDQLEVKRIDTKEFEFPDTLFVRDIENQVFQGIVFQCLSKIEGVALVEGNFIDNIFGRNVSDNLKGITVEQNNRDHSVSVKIEVNVVYGCSIPEKAEEIQTLCTEEITKATGLHVASVHVIFKSVLLPNQLKKRQLSEHLQAVTTTKKAMSIEEEYNDEF